MAADGRTDSALCHRLAAAVLPAALLPFAGSFVYFVAYPGETWARWAYVAVKLFTLVWPFAASAWILGRRLPRVDWRSPRHRRALPAGLVFGGLVIAAALLLVRTPLGVELFAFALRVRHKVEQLGVLDHYIAFALFLSVAHSAVEEIYWRWFVYGRLREALRPAPAMAIASLAFASHHAVILGQYVSLSWVVAGTAAVAGAGAVWCRMYERQRTLSGAWLSHLLADLAVLWVGYRMLF